METRWVLLTLTLLCMGSCSFLSSTSAISLVLPIGAAIFGGLCVIAFISDRISSVSRGDGALMSDPETLRLLSERAKAAAARNAQRQVDADSAKSAPHRAGDPSR